MFSARRLLGKDAAIYRDIRLEGLKAVPEAFGSDFEREAGMSPDEWSSRMEQAFTFGVFEGEELVGVATYFVEGMEKVRHRAHLVGVYVRPRARGKGASQVLFETLIASARDKVVQLHLVTTTENTAARRLYERFGFRIYGTDPRGLKVGGKYYDDHLMVLRLDEGSKKVTDNE